MEIFRRVPERYGDIGEKPSNRRVEIATAVRRDRPLYAVVNHFK
jgi:hypothetical protein